MLSKTRLIQKHITQLHAHSRGRLLVLTGARQVGKSTLAQMAFPNMPILSFDDPQERVAYARLTPTDWITHYPVAIIDEAQKMPSIFHTLKACYDRDPNVRYVLLGSSQIMMLKQVSETLAGRVALQELFPFCLPELVAALGAPPRESLLMRLLKSEKPADLLTKEITPHYVLQIPYAQAKKHWDTLLHWGGMPSIYQNDFTDNDRAEWLRDYQTTYLQRDLADLARLDRLEPFIRAQRAAASRTAQTINFAELARLSDVTPPTAHQFMRYLELSYQVMMLPAWFRNAEKRLTKQPKLHFLDNGVRRAILNQRGDVDGHAFESAVVSEIVKQSKTARLPLEFSHLRTADKREVDLLIEREDGFIAIECKQTEHVVASDFKHMRELKELLDKPLLLACVISNDNNLVCISPSGPTNPAFWKLSAPALLA